jgi:hypothetical protein
MKPDFSHPGRVYIASRIELTAVQRKQLAAYVPSDCPVDLRDKIIRAAAGAVGSLQLPYSIRSNRKLNDEAKAVAKQARLLLGVIKRTDHETRTLIDFSHAGLKGERRGVLSRLWDVLEDAAAAADGIDLPLDSNKRLDRERARHIAEAVIHQIWIEADALPPKSEWVHDLVQRVAEIASPRAKLRIGGEIIDAVLTKKRADFLGETGSIPARLTWKRKRARMLK